MNSSSSIVITRYMNFSSLTSRKKNEYFILLHAHMLTCFLFFCFFFCLECDYASLALDCGVSQLLMSMFCPDYLLLNQIDFNQLVFFVLMN